MFVIQKAMQEQNFDLSNKIIVKCILRLEGLWFTQELSYALVAQDTQH